MNDSELMAAIKNCAAWADEVHNPATADTLRRALALIEQLQFDLAAEREKHKLSERVTQDDYDRLIDAFNRNDEQDKLESNYMEFIKWLKEMER